MIIIASYSNVSVTYTADGTQTVFSFPFDYLRKAFVYVEINNETPLEQGIDFSVYEKTIVFTEAPVTDTVIKIYRQTDTTPLVSWADASVLRAKDMTIQQIQVLHILEEDQTWIRENTIYKTDDKWDAGDNTIGNVGDPEEPNDAATKEYVDNTYQTVTEKLDNLDDAVETATEAKDTAVEAADKAEAALEEIKDKASWYDTVEDMKAAEGLISGMIAETKGYHTVNDGEGASYFIREAAEGETGDDGNIILLNNGMVAEKLTVNTYDRSVLNFEYVRNEGFKHYYKYSSNISAVYGCYMGMSETSHNTFIAMMFPVEYKLNYMEGYITDKAILVEFDSNFQEIRRSGELTLYHGRTLSFYNDKIYVTATTSGNTDLTKIVVVVDYNTLTVEEEMTLDIGTSYIWFKDGYMYTGTRSRIEKRELDGTLISTKTLSGLPAFHSLKPYKNMYIGTLNYPNGISLLSSEFKIIKNYSLPYIYNRGEIKDIAVVGDDIYIGFNDRNYIRGNDYELSECYPAILHLNLIKNVVQSIYYAYSNGNFDSITVDPTTTSTLQNGSDSNPFATILQATARGYKFIQLKNSSGLFYFGNDDITIEGSNSTIYLGDCRDCKINLRSVTITDDTAVANSLTSVDLTLKGCIVNATINSKSSRINSNTSCPINGDRGTETNFPVTNPQTGYERYEILNATNGQIAVPFSSFAPGAYFFNLRFTANNGVITANLSSPEVDKIPQYFVTSLGNGAIFSGYFNCSITGGKIVPTLSNCYLNNSAVTPSITRLVVTHIP